MNGSNTGELSTNIKLPRGIRQISRQGTINIHMIQKSWGRKQVTSLAFFYNFLPNSAYNVFHTSHGYWQSCHITFSATLVWWVFSQQTWTLEEQGKEPPLLVLVQQAEQALLVLKSIPNLSKTLPLLRGRDQNSELQNHLLNISKRIKYQLSIVFI